MNEADTSHADGERPSGETSKETSDAPVLSRDIPPPIEMVALLGPRDELLRTM